MELYIYYLCDEWKSYDSMKLVGVFDSKHLTQIVVNDLRDGTINAGGYEEDEILEMDASQLNTILEYGYIESVMLNEIQ